MTLSTNHSVPRPAVFPVVATSAQAHALQEAKSSGFTQGHAAGYVAGLQRAEQEAAAQAKQQNMEHEVLLATLETRQTEGLGALNLAIAALTNRTVPVLAHAEQALFGYALELAQALLGHELRDGETSARAALARACARAHTEIPVSIRMNPADIAALPNSDFPDGVAIQNDASIGRGDAIAEYADGFLDARLATALDRARSALLGDFLPASELTADAPVLDALVPGAQAPTAAAANAHAASRMTGRS